MSGPTPNQSLERTHQTVIKFAYANLPPAWRAAQLRFKAALRPAVQTLQQEVSDLRREPNSHDGQNRADVPCKERKWVWLSSCSE
jgi:hypothetical protein